MIHAQPIHCLSLCGLTLRRERGAEGVVQLVERLVAEGFGAADDEPLSRVYIGSSFCPNVLLALDAHEIASLAAWCSREGVALTLTIPLATERLLENVNRHVWELLDAAGGAIDELTVNDYGAFVRWGQEAADYGLGLNLGRMLQKDPRDPRDPIYPDLTWVPTALRRDWQGWAGIDRLVATAPVSGIEFDPTHAILDLSALPSGLVAGVHGPLCYMSTGRICEFASIGREVEEKFRPNELCTFQCQKTSIRYTGASGVEFAKLGRSVFYETDAPQVTGVETYRFIHTPRSILPGVFMRSAQAAGTRPGAYVQGAMGSHSSDAERGR